MTTDKNLGREGSENISAILSEICDMQAANYGNGVATHLALIDLTDRARAALAAQPQAGAAVPSVAGAAGAGEVKTWQERATFLPPGHKPSTPVEVAMAAQIADLHAQLARLQAPAGEPVARITFAHEVDGPWRLELNGVTISRHGNRADLDEAVKDLRAALTTPPSAQQEPVAYGLFAMVDCKWVLQHPVRFTRTECEQDRRMYRSDTKFKIEPLGVIQQEQGDAVRDAALEEAANAVEGFRSAMHAFTLTEVAKAIRALRATNTEGKEQQ